jgi:hypothetical protein
MPHCNDVTLFSPNSIKTAFLYKFLQAHSTITPGKKKARPVLPGCHVNLTEFGQKLKSSIHENKEEAEHLNLH